MDNFYNFNNEEPEVDPRAPREDKNDNTNASVAKVAALKRVNTALIIISIVLALAMIVNIVVLASLKNTIAENYLSSLAQTIKNQYQSAIEEEITDKNIIDDVVDRAAEGALERLDVPIGEYVSASCIDGVAIVKCTDGSSVVNATGFLISDNDKRYMLTNHHVVTYETTSGGFLGSQTVTKNYTDIKCSFYGESIYYSLKIVALDEGKDLALLTFTTSFPPTATHKSLTLANSDYMTLGEEVALIGNPEGIGLSVATGVISHEARTISNWGTANYLMTDAAVNPGNSGGAMINKNGVVVGVVESKLVSENIDNMGFAIAISSVIEFLESSRLAVNNELNVALNYTYSAVGKL